MAKDDPPAERRSTPKPLASPRSVGSRTSHVRRLNLGDALGRAVAVVILLAGGLMIALGQIWDVPVMNDIFQEAGYVLIGTVLVTFIYDWVLRRQHDANMIALLETSLARGASEQGLIGVYQKLSFRQLFDNLRAGDELLWLDTYCPDLPNFQNNLVDALARGARVKMLAIDPDSPTLPMRAYEIDPFFGYSLGGHDPSTFRREAELQIKHLGQALSSVSPLGAFELRLYDDLPGVPMYLHLRKGRAFTGFTGFFLGAPSFQEPHLKWKYVTDGYLQKMVDHFIAKWERFPQSVCIDASCRRQVSLHTSSADCGPASAPGLGNPSLSQDGQEQV